MKYIFGPVSSRRLGVSLGVDILPMKTCTLDCIYCECGRSSTLKTLRKEYTPVSEVTDELYKYLERSDKPDFITFSGGGEPTLNSAIGRIIDYIKDSYPEIKVALITNGTLLYRSDVRRDIRRADIIMPSLDAVSGEIFERINRPSSGISPELIIQGIRKMKEEMEGEIWAEVFILPGINNSDSELELIKKELLKISPDKVQLNTLDRPAPVLSAGELIPADLGELERIKEFWRPLEVEIISSGNQKKYKNRLTGREELLGLLSRRPCTLDELKKLYSEGEEELMIYLQELENSDRITRKIEERGEFYKIK